jgi:4-amino-4-deoxychorismate lyase
MRSVTDAGGADGCWINGRPADRISVRNRGLHFGDGLFEILPVHNGKIALLERHLERLHNGCRHLALPFPPRARLLAELAEAAHGQVRAILKLIITRGGEAFDYRPDPDTTGQRILLRLPWPDYPPAWAERGVQVRICDAHLGHNPRLAGLKHLNRLEQVLARAEWSGQEGIQEGLMTDIEGSVVGGTMGNVFAWLSHGVLATPSLRLCGVAGVMRGYLLDCARESGIQVRIASLSLTELMRAPEIVLCNSLIGVWPVVRIGPWKYAIGEVTRRMQRWAQVAADAHP